MYGGVGLVLVFFVCVFVLVCIFVLFLVGGSVGVGCVW